MNVGNKLIVLLAYSMTGGLVFGMTMLAFQYLRSSPYVALNESDIVYFIVLGVFGYGLPFFLLFSVVMLTMYALSKRRVEKKYGPQESYEPQQRRTVMVHKDHQTIFARCLYGLQKIGARVERSDHAEGIIRARTEKTMRSWGESIEIHVSPKGTDAHEVVITSTPILSSTLFDLGKGVANVEELRRAIAGES